MTTEQKSACHQAATQTQFSPREAQEQRLPSHAAVIHEEIRHHGEQELHRDAVALLLSAVAAGLSMGLSLLVKALLALSLPETPAMALIEHAGYAVGFIVVIIAQQQLFTENTLTVVLPVMHQPRAKNMLLLLRLWTIVLLGNFVGTAASATVLQHWPVNHTRLAEHLFSISREGVLHDAQTLFRGSLISGWLVATMVWMFPYAGSAKIVVILLITWMMSVAGLPHIVVGSVEAVYLMLNGQLSWQEFLWHFAGPTLAGNIIGGTLIFAVLSHAQIRSDLADRRTQKSQHLHSEKSGQK